MGKTTRRHESEEFDVSETAIAEGGGTAPEVNSQVDATPEKPASERPANDVAMTMDLQYRGELAIAGIYVLTEDGPKLLGYVSPGGVLRDVPRELAEIALKNRKDLQIAPETRGRASPVINEVAEGFLRDRRSKCT